MSTPALKSLQRVTIMVTHESKNIFVNTKLHDVSPVASLNPLLTCDHVTL